MTNVYYAKEYIGFDNGNFKNANKFFFLNL